MNARIALRQLQCTRHQVVSSGGHTIGKWPTHADARALRVDLQGVAQRQGGHFSIDEMKAVVAYAHDVQRQRELGWRFYDGNRLCF